MTFAGKESILLSSSAFVYGFALWYHVPVFVIQASPQQQVTCRAMTSAGEHVESFDELSSSKDVVPARMQEADSDRVLGLWLSSSQQAPAGGNLGSREKKALSKELIISIFAE